MIVGLENLLLEDSLSITSLIGNFITDRGSGFTRIPSFLLILGVTAFGHV